MSRNGLDAIKGALYIIQILCRRYTFWSYPAGLTIADPPGKQKLKYRRVYSHHFQTTIAEEWFCVVTSISIIIVSVVFCGVPRQFINWFRWSTKISAATICLGLFLSTTLFRRPSDFCRLSDFFFRQHFSQCPMALQYLQWSLNAGHCLGGWDKAQFMHKFQRFTSLTVWWGGPSVRLCSECFPASIASYLRASVKTWPKLQPLSWSSRCFCNISFGVLAIISSIILSTSSGSPKSHKLPLWRALLTNSSVVSFSFWRNVINSIRWMRKFTLISSWFGF